jgi:hypothetical protein
MNTEQQLTQVINADKHALERVKDRFAKGDLSAENAAHDIIDTVFLIEHNQKRLDAHLEKKKKK